MSRAKPIGFMDMANTTKKQSGHTSLANHTSLVGSFRLLYGSLSSSPDPIERLAAKLLIILDIKGKISLQDALREADDSRMTEEDTLQALKRLSGPGAADLKIFYVDHTPPILSPDAPLGRMKSIVHQDTMWEMALNLFDTSPMRRSERIEIVWATSESQALFGKTK